MPRFFYNRDSKYLFASGLLPTEAYGKTICLSFEIIEAVWLRKPKSFRSRANHLDFLLLRASPHSIQIFSSSSTTPQPSFRLHHRCTAAAPWRRWFCGRRCIFFIFEQLHYAAAASFHQRRCCVVPPTLLLRRFASATAALFRQRRCCVVPPAPLRCHFIVDEIVSAPLLLCLLQATITKVLLHTALHSACTAIVPSRRLFRHR